MELPDVRLCLLGWRNKVGWVGSGSASYHMKLHVLCL